MRITIILICIFLTNQLMSQTAFSAILQQTETELIYLYAVPFEEIQKRNDSLSTDGFELADLEYHEDKFWAIWRKTGHSTTLGRSDSWEAFQEIKKEKIKQGRLLTSLLVYEQPDGQQQFVGCWKNKRQPHNVWKLKDLKSARFHYQEMAKLNLYLQQIQAVEEADGRLSYYLLYHKGIPAEKTHFTHFSDEKAFDEDRTKRLKSGYQPIDLEIERMQGLPQYFCIYQKKSGAAELQYQLDWESLLHYQTFLGGSFKVTNLEFSEGQHRVFAPPFNLTRIEKTPDTDMNSLQISVKGNDSAINTQSPVFAAANGLVWLAENGFPKLKPGQSSNATNTIARKLADGNHMKTLLPSQTSVYSIIEGLGKYVRNSYDIREINYYDIHSFYPDTIAEDLNEVLSVSDNLTELPMQKAKEGLVGPSVVLIRWGMYQPSSDGKNLIKKSERWGTLVGYGKNKHGVEKPNYLVVHDPADGDQPRQKYFRVDDLEQYFITTQDTQLLTPEADWKDEAENFSKEPALKRQLLSEFEEGTEDVKVFPVWESLLILRVKN